MSGPALSKEWLLGMLTEVRASNPGTTVKGIKGYERAVWDIEQRIIEAAKQTGPRQLAPVARRDGPANSKVAAVMIEPQRGSRKAKVLDKLRQANGAWVSVTTLTTEEIGGSQGDRRLRELRADGWPIETKRPNHGGAWLHRLLPSALPPFLEYGAGQANNLSPDVDTP